MPAADDFDAATEQARRQAQHAPDHLRIDGTAKAKPKRKANGKAGEQVSEDPGDALPVGLRCRAGAYGEGRNGSLYRITDTAEAGPTLTPLCNFRARIVADILRDDGIDPRRVFEVEAQVGSRTVEGLLLEPAEFARMEWPLAKLGATASIAPGGWATDHIRAAIQALSARDGIPSGTVYTHTGWRLIGERWAFLMPGGSIGADAVDVALPRGLDHFAFPALPDADVIPRLADAAFRAMLALAEPSVALAPLLFAFRAAIPLDPPDFTLWMHGRTGTFKTETAALVQQHFGAGMHARKLPANWSSTANTLEVVAFATKNVLIVIDDWAPGETRREQAEAMLKAERIIRATGNSAGRGRLDASMNVRPPRHPRGAVLVTAEDQPPIHSIRARCLIVHVPQGAVSQQALTKAQRLAADGVMASAMAAWVSWLAVDADAAARHFAAEVLSARARLAEVVEAEGGEATHWRTLGALAELAATWRMVAAWLGEIGVALPVENEQVDASLAFLIGEQRRAQASANPVQQFLGALATAISLGRACLAAKGSDGAPPRQPERWGWRRREHPVRAGEQVVMEVSWEPAPMRIGWLDEDKGLALLEPGSAYLAAADTLRMSGTALSRSSQTLWALLAEAGVIEDRDKDRSTKMVKVGGKAARFLVLAAGLLRSEEDEP